MTLVFGPDGYPAREVKPWSREKLHIVEDYLNIFTTGMKNRWALVYADLLAGPGLCVTPTGTVFEGSALLAARHTEFQALFLNAWTRPLPRHWHIGWAQRVPRRARRSVALTAISP